MSAGVNRKRCERRDRDDEDDGQACQQDRERDLVRRLLPLRTFDERDHPVEERLAGIRGDANQDAIRKHTGSTGDGAAIAARRADDRGGLPRNRRFVDACGTFDHVTVARNQLAGVDAHDVAAAQRGGADDLLFPVDDAARGRLRLRAPHELRLRFSAAFRHRFGEVREYDGKPQPRRDREVETGTAVARREDVTEEKAGDCRGADFDDEHDGIAHLDARVELHERVKRRAPQNRGVEE